GGEEGGGGGEGGGEVAPHVLLAVEPGEVAERLHVRLELQGADEGVGRLVRILQPLEVDAGDLAEDGLPRLDGGGRLDLLLQRDDELAVAPSPAEHRGHGVEG